MRDQGVYREHILECITRVERYTADELDRLVDDQMTQDAVLRNLQILAESCMRMSSEIRDRRKEIDWRGISGFRNVLVHDYLDLVWERIWAVVQTDLPPLSTVISEELARVDADIREKGEGEST